jgi:hypothetical protein
MAFSGTVSQTVFNTRKVIDNAIRRCKVPAQTITSEHIDIAKDQLYLLLSDLANQGTPLWCIERQIIPLYEGVPSISLDSSTVDILNSNLRWLQNVSGSILDTSTTRMFSFASSTYITTVGVLWSDPSVPIALEQSDDGLVWETVQTETPSATAGQWTWYDLNYSRPCLFFRVRATSGTLNFSDVYLGNSPTEIPLARMNRDDYTNLPNKYFQSLRPTVYQFIIWRQRYIMDVGTLTEELEVPQRWFEAIVSMLAAKMALELTEVDPALIPMLDQKAAYALSVAQMEERDNSPMMISPNISMYTR